MPNGTYNGAQHRFLRRTEDPIKSNQAYYDNDKTYDKAAFPNTPKGPGTATLPGNWTNYPLQQTLPLQYPFLKNKAGYGIMGLDILNPDWPTGPTVYEP